jgi:hypothetical protein
MKAIIVIIFFSGVALTFLAACGNWGRKGNGHVVTEDKPVTPFSKISIEGIFPVELSQTGGKEWVKVETDENLQPFIEVKNHGDELIVRSADKSNINRATKMRVYINLKNINELSFSSVGNLTTNDVIKLDSLDLKSESVGKLDLDIEADYLHADLNAVGNTTLRGKVREARINNKSVGSLSAADLKTKTLMIHNTAVGSAEIYADSAFYIRSSSIGTLYYKGPGEVKELKSEGIGKVQKQD